MTTAYDDTGASCTPDCDGGDMCTGTRRATTPAAHAVPDTRTLAARIAASQRTTQAPAEQMAAARALLADMLAAADRHGVALADFDFVADLPAACMNVIRVKSRRADIRDYPADDGSGDGWFASPWS